jgi:hypothetical protein
MRAIQRVKNFLKNINPLIRNYVIALIISTGRKNCAAMSHATGISDKYLYDFLAEADVCIRYIREDLIRICKKNSEEKNGRKALAVDPTHIIKPYANRIGKLCYDRTGTTKRTEKCLVPIFDAVIDQSMTIPLSLKFWMQEKLIIRGRYKSKALLTRELIAEALKDGIKFDFVPLDGGYAVPEMFNFFDKEKISFIMRMPKSRAITTEDGIRAQLKFHPALKLRRNERQKTVKAEYQGRTYFFTAHKRKSRDGGYETVYLIGTMDLSAKQQVEAYDMRWPLEKFIRTAKQKFGAMQCQATDAEKQHAHIMAGCLAYAILDSANIDKEAMSVDELVNIIRDFYVDDLIALVKKPVKNCMHVSDDQHVKSPQKQQYVDDRNNDSVSQMSI